MNPPENPFAAPWQAQAFAMTVALHQAGLFTWSEWAATLGRMLQGAAADGSDYYDRWLLALEALLAEKGQAAPAEIDALADLWTRAALATPHGQPIRLENAGAQGNWGATAPGRA